ncbi:hypothetical protein Tco_1382365 [Tanacetum coccineum]
MYTTSEQFGCFSDDELEAPDAAPQSPGQALPSLDYVLGPQHPPSPDYLPGSKEPEQAPLSPDYVPDPEYSEYLVPSDAGAPMEEQPLLDDASPIALSPGYIADSDPEEDPKADPADYLADRGDDADDESSDDDDDDDDEEEEEEQEVSEDDDEDEEHPALADSYTIPADNPVPTAEDTEAFKKDESAPTPYAYAPTPPSPSPLSLLSSPLPQIPLPPLPLPSLPTTSPTYVEAPLGYRAARIRLRVVSPSTYHPSDIPSPPLLLPSTTPRYDLPEVDMPLRKRARFTAPTDTWDELVDTIQEIAPTTVKGLSQRVADLSTTFAQDTHEIHVLLEDAQDDRALQRGRVNMLFRDRQFHRHTTMLLKSEARHAREAWSHFMNCSKAVHAKLQAYRTSEHI